MLFFDTFILNWNIFSNLQSWDNLHNWCVLIIWCIIIIWWWHRGYLLRNIKFYHATIISKVVCSQSWKFRFLFFCMKKQIKDERKNEIYLEWCQNQTQLNICRISRFMVITIIWQNTISIWISWNCRWNWWTSFLRNELRW